MKKPLLIVIAGPTASGKTSAAIHVAQHFKTEILSFDSRQCYIEMNIGVARPSPQELAAVPHHFIASHSIHEPINASGYEYWALHVLEQLFQQQEVVVAAGGTGLYLQALLHGLDDMPAINPELRQQLREAYENNGTAWLQQQLQELDTRFACEGEMQNPHRMLRALEVKMQTGKSIISFHEGAVKKRPFHVLQYALDVPRKQLHHQIETRVHQMVAAGLFDEVKALLPFRNLQALQTVGYKEIFAFIDGNISKEEAIHKIVVHTRQYAKRQITWFKKDPQIKWISPGEIHKTIDDVSVMLTT